MKTLLLIIFKILEIITLIASYFLLVRIGFWFDNLAWLADPSEYHWTHPFYLMSAFLCIAIPSVIGAFLYLIIQFTIPGWIKLNKRWVNKILKKD